MAFGIWNNLDELALYMGLERLGYETDEEFFNRIKQFAVYKYKTDYYTQVHSIPLQLGLKTYEMMRLSCSYTDPDTEDVTIIPFQCSIDWEYFYLENFPPAGMEHLKEYYRIFINSHSAKLSKILDVTESSQTFNLHVLMGKYRRLPCKFIVRSSNKTTGRDFINTKYTKLNNSNLISGTFNTEDTQILKKRVASLIDLKRAGDYYLDDEKGYLETFSNIETGFFVTYEYYKSFFSVEGTEMNLIPLDILAKYGLTDQLAEYAKIILEDKVWGK